MENISWTGRVRDEEVLQRIKGEMNIQHTIKQKKANCVGLTLRSNCLLNHMNEGKMEVRREVTERRGRRREQLLGDPLGKRDDTVHWKRKH